MIREVYLIQYAYDPVDTYCPLEKQYDILRGIKMINDWMFKALEMGKPIEEILNVPGKEKFARVKFEKDYKPLLEEALDEIKKNLVGE